MKKIVLFFILSFFLVAPLSFAVTDIPAQTVTLDPQSAPPGAPVKINAFVYNGTQNTATIVVQFITNKNEVIGKQTVLVPPVSARTAVQVWKMPNQPMVITASIISAVNDKKVEIKELMGDLGAVTIVPPTDAIDTENTSWKEKITTWGSTFFSKVELFRVDTVTYFKTMRDSARERLGISTTSAITSVPAPQSSSADYKVESDLPATKSAGNPTDYATVIFASAFAAFFGNEIAFYLGAILIIFFVVRFLYTRFI